jgi:EAL domain-containing protein (putative c-di-GMP-specific phosphodiesterase class I)/CheY-like chemotaxis protein
MSRRVISARELKAELEQAVRCDRLSLRYQPIVDLTTGQIVAVEALVRWEHPAWGTISPVDFIPIAERSSLIARIDRWVLRTACEQVRGWQLRFPRCDPLVACVNLSAKLIDRQGLVGHVREVLDATGLEASCLRLEVTETVLMKDAIAHMRTLRALRQFGVGIAIDDFGTGYSSLSYLRWLPADVLKLDRSFVVRLGKDPRDAVIIQGVIGIAQGLGMTVTAEGIETQQQCSQLCQLGCSRGQGYHFAPPLTPDDLTVLLQRERLGHTLFCPNVNVAGTETGATAAGRSRVLVVDDDEHIRGLVSCALELEGYEVVAAEDGEAALEQIAQQPPDLILLDMMMPGMDGRRFSQVYRARPGRHAPIIVLTAIPDAASCATEIGAASYLSKPFEIDAMLTSVDRLVATSSA